MSVVWRLSKQQTQAMDERETGGEKKKREVTKKEDEEEDRRNEAMARLYDSATETMESLVHCCRCEAEFPCLFWRRSCVQSLWTHLSCIMGG